ncbi:hypothetical protein Desaf_0288 [Desulfocurvibacter africanus subsp. africanus str. Walvis Bay]|uniref:Uncharacterized protein n=1 Tax=Desulfocurvibacter africanus subsp. africanus str. Walvis Bay TaxID=690850 RepID=F3YU40_DESAF|nr:hypothetical protein Desaf_0288 [Desulfocurvibacter africanus subsp. africanus str. Walvis Bay]
MGNQTRIRCIVSIPKELSVLATVSVSHSSAHERVQCTCSCALGNARSAPRCDRSLRASRDPYPAASSSFGEKKVHVISNIQQRHMHACPSPAWIPPSPPHVRPPARRGLPWICVDQRLPQRSHKATGCLYQTCAPAPGSTVRILRPGFGHPPPASPGRAVFRGILSARGPALARLRASALTGIPSRVHGHVLRS